MMKPTKIMDEQILKGRHEVHVETSFLYLPGFVERVLKKHYPKVDVVTRVLLNHWGDMVYVLAVPDEIYTEIGFVSEMKKVLAHEFLKERAMI